jgi:hypothetical protein
MKKTSADLDDDLRPHYDFDYQKTKPNRFASMELIFKGRRSVFLDEDVADVFDSSEAVNTVLRSAIKAMRTATPKPTQPRRAASKQAGKRKAS